jgi:hypothetical protein
VRWWAVPAADAAKPVTSVTMVSEPGDWVGAGVTQVFHPGNAVITAFSGQRGVHVRIAREHAGADISMDFSPPPGRPLEPGLYRDAECAAFGPGTRPGLEVWGDGRACNEVAGEFEIKDIARGADGTIERLWLRYEQHCEGGDPALFGEVRIDMPARSRSRSPRRRSCNGPRSTSAARVPRCRCR